MICVYCDSPAIRTVKIADGIHSVVPKEKRSPGAPATILKTADQRIWVCGDHVEQVLRAVGEDKPKRVVRQQVIQGQMAIEDYLI